MDRSSQAIVMHRYGPPAVLALEPLTLSALAPGEIRLRSLASAVNHSDLEIRAGNWPIRRDPPFPYVPGLEVVGEIVEVGSAVSEFHPGERAMTMMQGLGGVRAERPGGYAELVTVAASAAAPIPADLDSHDMAALGLASVTALEGLRRLGPLTARRIVVTGASGGVGSAAIGLARAEGAEVVAVVARTGRRDYVRALGASEAMLGAEAAAGRLGEHSVDGILDTVAGELFAPCVAALRPGGVLSLVGAVGGNAVVFDAYYLLDAVLTGYSSERLDGAGLRRAVAAIGDWLRRGAIRPPARTLFPLAEAAAAHAALEHRGVEGRLLLVPPSG